MTDKYHKHTKEQCQQVVVGTRDLIQQIKNIDDKATRDAVCESAIELCDQLIRDGKEIRK